MNQKASNLKEIQRSLIEAAALCQRDGTQLTPIRKLVLTLLYADTRGLKAYEILDQLKLQKPNATPPTVYRALDFLVKQGLVHKISRLNLFKACVRHCNTHHQHTGLFLICPRCEEVTEVDDEPVVQAVMASLANAGYQRAAEEIEIGAVCPSCTAKAGKT